MKTTPAVPCSKCSTGDMVIAKAISGYFYDVRMHRTVSQCTSCGQREVSAWKFSKRLTIIDMIEEELKHVGEPYEFAVVDMRKRVKDWVLSHSDMDHPYLERQLEIAQLIRRKYENKFVKAV